MIVSFTIYPYVTQEGTIEVPDDVSDIEEYITEHFDDADLSEPDFDYAGSTIDM